MLKRISINAFIAVFLMLILVDGLPSTSLFHDRLKAAVDPLLDKTGLWQQSWQLFAPKVDRMNVRMSATFSYADGSESEWHSPAWTELSILQRFLRFREMEFIDAVRNDANQGAWESFSRYLADQDQSANGHPHRVVLRRHWATVPDPVPGDRQKRLWPLPMQGSFDIYKLEGLER